MITLLTIDGVVPAAARLAASCGKFERVRVSMQTTSPFGDGRRTG
ncbi:hypothetical protein [Burkholderia contaminans]|nr:hypothetical protein [Burkholderia contaminans]